MGVGHFGGHAATGVAVFAGVGEVADAVANEALDVGQRVFASQVGAAARSRVERACRVVERGGAFDATTKAVVIRGCCAGIGYGRCLRRCCGSWWSQAY